MLHLVAIVLLIIEAAKDIYYVDESIKIAKRWWEYVVGNKLAVRKL